jgi:predicted O-linked N-acetylglucosamine transferase (SPINDLY family)
MLARLLRQIFARSAAPQPHAPADAEAALGRALECYGRGDYAGCEQLCRMALQRAPGLAAAHGLLGAAALQAGRPEAAVSCLEQAIALDPGSAEFHANCGEANRRCDRLLRAVQCFETALRLQPDAAGAWHNLALAEQELGDMQAAIAAFRRALELESGNPGFHSGMLFTLFFCAGIRGPEMLAEHRRWAALYADALTAAAPAHANAADPERPLRIGYVGAKFVACFVEPVLAQRDRRQFHIIVYDNGDDADADADARRLRQLADVWRRTDSLDDAAAANLIRSDGIDILVDLSGHTKGNRLLVFARQPAPLQVSYLGYLYTTGMQAVGFGITDAHIDPPGIADAYHQERLLRLPHSLWCFNPPAGMPEPGPLPALARGHVTFGSFNHLAKINEEVRLLWARLLQSVPGSRLLMLGVPAGESCDKLRATFARQGISAERLEIHGMLDYAQYLEVCRKADIALDPFPYNGGTTTCDSLWMGVPVITLAGSSGQARAGVSLLSAVDLRELIAQTGEEYLAIARALAADLDGLSALRSGMRARMRASPLMDAAGFARDLEAVYREIWRDWCRAQAAA